MFRKATSKNKDKVEGLENRIKQLELEIEKKDSELSLLRENVRKEANKENIENFQSKATKDKNVIQDFATQELQSQLSSLRQNYEELLKSKANTDKAVVSDLQTQIVHQQQEIHDLRVKLHVSEMTKQAIQESSQEIMRQAHQNTLEKIKEMKDTQGKELDTIIKEYQKEMEKAKELSTQSEEVKRLQTELQVISRL